MIKSKIKNQKSKRKSGYVLVSVLVIMSVMLIITYYLADVLFSELAIARNQKAATIAFNLAEAGVQEATWRVQYEPGTKDKFINSTDGQTDFSHDPALLTGGSYAVNITNTAKGAATITSTGFFNIGLKKAQRKIVVNITQATVPPPYVDNGAILTGGATGEEDITLTLVTMNVTGTDASLISNRDIWFTLSTVNVVKDILAKRYIRNLWSTVNYGGVLRENDTGTYTMPSVDVSSDDPGSYKSKAIAQGQYFTASQFNQLLNAGSGTLTYSGIVYIAGPQGLVIKNSHSLTVNGTLVVEGSIDVGKPLSKGTLIINHVEGQPSGVITLSKFTAWAYSQITINGLVYVGDRFSFDPWFSFYMPSKTITIKGGILARRFEGRGLRIINLELNKDWINEALQPNPPATPVIQTQHWEEEY